MSAGRFARRKWWVWFALAALALLIAGALVGIQLIHGGILRPPLERLWSGGAPGAVGNEPADIPSILVFVPPRWRASGAGIVICPGGAYSVLMSSYEGADIARWLNSFGVAGFVLNYRIAPRYRYPAPFADATRALRYVRYNAARFGLQPDRVGIIGFSAGGHLASTVITHFDSGNNAASDPVERVSSRPDFGILAYPIITLHAPWTHELSVYNLLGPNPDPALIDELSNERHVTARTPPTFLFHTGEDSAVPPENSVLFWEAFRKAGVPCEAHIYQYGPHGVGLANGYGRAPRVRPVLSWSKLAEDWLRSKWLPKRRWSYSRLFRL